MEWWATFWNKHGERLIFLVLANSLAGVLLAFKLITPDEAKVMFIGSAMLLYNKSRSPNGGTNEPTETVPTVTHPVDISYTSTDELHSEPKTD